MDNSFFTGKLFIQEKNKFPQEKILYPGETIFIREKIFSRRDNFLPIFTKRIRKKKKKSDAQVGRVNTFHILQTNVKDLQPSDFVWKNP
jgi:hypothetical protein